MTLGRSESRNFIEVEMYCRVCSGQSVLQLEMSGRTGRASTKSDMIIYVESISWSLQTPNKEHNIVKFQLHHQMKNIQMN